ncbi:MAG: alpha,2-mannosyltransferase [Actinoplanes sp.]|nr:alpha,2-mannosyltransferase [Actinoplanes sp.]
MNVRSRLSSPRVQLVAVLATVAAAVAVVLVVWWIRTWRAIDHLAGFALTGVVACLISPVTWVHHLVWLLPALFLMPVAAGHLKARHRSHTMHERYHVRPGCAPSVPAYA